METRIPASERTSQKLNELLTKGGVRERLEGEPGTSSTNVSEISGCLPMARQLVLFPMPYFLHAGSTQNRARELLQ